MSGSPIAAPGGPAFWPLDPEITFLNHGSFGSCPLPVLEFQRGLRDRLEREPVDFLIRDLEPMLDEARGVLARFVGAEEEDLVFVPNATTGVNTVLRSLAFGPGDELLTTDHAYAACRNALEFVAARSGARVAVASVPFPLDSADRIAEAVLAKVTPRTRIALLDHVTSPTAIRFPVETLVAALAARGVDAIVDGAHAPGMLPLDVAAIGAAYYTGNLHKWVCAPKGAGFLWVRRDRQDAVRPLSISHGANTPRSDRSRFQIEFAWTGTADPSAFLSVPEALRHVGSRLPGGWPEVMARNRTMALDARDLLCRRLGTDRPCPDELIGSIASIPIPDARPGDRPHPRFLQDPLQLRLRGEHAIEVPVFSWPAAPKRLLRVSAQLYNALPQYERLAAAL